MSIAVQKDKKVSTVEKPPALYALFLRRHRFEKVVEAKL